MLCLQIGIYLIINKKLIKLIKRNFIKKRLCDSHFLSMNYYDDREITLLQFIESISSKNPNKCPKVSNIMI